MRVLVTGFEPFGGDAVNPSQCVAERLAGWRPDVHTRVLPVEYGRAGAVLDQALDELAPELVIALGLAPSRTEVTVERVAINLDDARIPDNAGRQPVDVPVVPGGPAAHFASLPVKAIVAALRDAGLPASLSLSAGSFLCNHVFYALAHRVAAGGPPARAGFIHLPPLEVLPLHAQCQAVQLAVATALAVREDLVQPGGAID